MQADAMTQMIANFNDPTAIAQYTEGLLRFVPAYAELNRMTAILAYA